MADDEISLRPIALRPTGLSGTNPFSVFAKGSGIGLKSKHLAKPTDDTKPKRDAERIKYSKDFLMQFMDRFVNIPVELAQQSVLNAEIIIQEEHEKDAQRQALQKVVEERIEEDDDRRDWRTRDSTDQQPSAKGDSWEQTKEPQRSESNGTAKPPQAVAKSQPAAAPATGEDGMVIAKAADQGLQAYRPGAAVSSEERAVRQIKGVLNKLTPEKFDRLLQQLLGIITTADILRSTITLVFETAVEQPTYCAMYADLCLQLSKELPSFPPPPNSDKPITFIQILLNTCQDEFEGAEEARVQLQSVSSPAEREEMERSVKKRVMGTMRLISELYKKEMVRDWIFTTCMESLLSKEKGKSSEDSIEAACEMLTTAGQNVAKSESEKMRRKLEDVFKQLAALEKEKSLSSRIRFVLRDVIDLRKNNWVARRETFTAKKLDEVRAQAEAELGMVSSVALTASLPVLPAHQRMGPADDFALIPPLRGDAEVQNWGSSGSTGLNFAGGQSALLGEIRPPQATVQLHASTTSPAPSGSGLQLSEEELKRKTENLLAEFASTFDKAEAVTCIRELGSPAFMPQMVEMSLTTMMNSIKDKEVAALEDLLLYLHAQGLVSTEDVISGLATFTVQLEDISLDFPKAPSILGHAVGSAVLQGILALDALPQLLEGDFGVQPKREFAAAALKHVHSQAGIDGLSEMCAKAGIKASQFLGADAALDPDAPSVEEWIKQEGLEGAVPV